MSSTKKENGSSPFDEALNRPMLQEPVKKKWRLLKPSTWKRGRRSGIISKKESCSFSESPPVSSSGIHDENESVTFRSESTGGAQDDVFSDELRLSDEQGDNVVVSSKNNNLVQDQRSIRQEAKMQQILSMEAAIMQERHSDLTEITDTMRQIYSIQHDLSFLVDGQQDMVDDLVNDTEQASETVKVGLEEVWDAFHLNGGAGSATNAGTRKVKKLRSSTSKDGGKMLAFSWKEALEHSLSFLLEMVAVVSDWLATNDGGKGKVNLTPEEELTTSLLSADHITID